METSNFTREELAQYILHTAKDAFIEKIQAMIPEDKEEDIVGYTVQGEPITVSKMNERLAQGEDDIKKGRIITDEDLAKEIETW